MHSWFACACLLGAFILLFVLSIIDLRVRLLPNELVAGVAFLGLLFHAATYWAFVTPLSALTGAVLGGGLLYAVRAIATYYYKEDPLGLGDVKLVAAGGIWLGGGTIMLALAAGALLAVIHGLGHGLWAARRAGVKLDLARLKVPAGPGFAGGLILGAVWRFWLQR